MPAISKIRFTNVVFEDGQKRYNDDLFRFEGHNGAIVLENGGGKTVFIQTLLQAIIPHTNLGERKIRDTLKLDGGPAHIAVEWLLEEKPRRYAVTAVTLFLDDDKVKSYRYVYEYAANDRQGIEHIPFVKNDGTRAAERYEMQEYYTKMTQQSGLARTFEQIGTYRQFLEEGYHIIADEWNSIVKINQDEGGIEKFFDNCKLDKHLFDRLLIPTVESSIAGFNEQGFANTFEEQQKSFKLYKELRAQIGEYQAIEEELIAFVKSNEQLARAEQKYVKQKGLVKGLYTVAQQQEEKSIREQTRIREALQHVKEKEVIQKAKHAAYEIALQKEKIVQETELYDQVKSDYEQRKFVLHDAAKQLHSLQYAKQRTIEKEQSELYAYFLEESQTLHQESNFMDLSDQLETVHGELRGYFMQAEERYEREKTGHAVELASIKDALDTTTEEERLVRTEKQTIEKMLTAIDTQIDSHEQTMGTMERKILANPKEESISSLLPEWILTEARLDEQMIALQSETKRLIEQLKDEKEVARKLQHTIEQRLIEHATLQKEVERMAVVHDEILGRLSQVSFLFSRTDSLYLRQATIEQDLLRKIEQFQREKEEKHLLERVAYRFIDDYGKQDVFFADPFLAEQLNSWTHQFGLVETGVQYVSGLDISVDEQLARYPFWSVTVITTEDKKQPLMEKVRSVAEQLTYPVYVIDLQEARELVDGQSPIGRQAVLPAHWFHNMDVDQFKTWKETMEIAAKRVTDERLGIESELEVWQSTLKSVQQFYEQYPYDLVKETEEQERLVQNELRQVQEELSRLRRTMSSNELQIDGNNQQINKIKDERHVLSRNIEAGQQYEKIVKEITRLTVDKEKAITEKASLKTSLLRVMRRKRHLDDDRAMMEEKIRDVQLNLKILENDGDYRRVRDQSPVFTDVSLEVLKQRRETIQFKLNEISLTRRELETKLAHAKERMEDAKQEMNYLENRGFDIDQKLNFPKNGDSLMEQYSDRERQASAKLDAAHISFNEQDKQLSVVQAKMDDLHERYVGRYPHIEIVTFSEPLSIVKRILKDEEVLLENEENQLQSARIREEKEAANMMESLQELHKFDEADHFTAGSIQEQKLTEEEENDFTYRRLYVVQQATMELRMARSAVDQEKKEVDSKRAAFHDYVRRHMSDAKMRDNLFQGLAHKQTYDELVEFQRNIQAKMSSIIRVNEESIREHDERLEQFITHMHEHAKTVVRELRMIPPKTSLKFSTGSKNVYAFRIPDWEDEAGRARLKAYIDDILSWIEHERYMEKDGKINANQIRTDVERWLATPQLLRIILQNNEMKVSCRKVTNDNEVTTKSYSWRESNEWSGGEKWSKNMTLFLGLLNYVAEKKQLLDTSMKRHRAVVLDNPFGKASSEHVLSPVFFIAERLGFQIIALTAHAEGKFLRDYFPVIYSLRLRTATNTSKQVMTKVRDMNRAYFQDHQPDDFDRLGDSEQLSLL